MAEARPSPSSPPIDVRPAHWEIVREILARHVPDREVWAFGSRAGGSPKPTSDLDLAVIGEQPLDMNVLTDLADAFSESDLPWRVDLLDWAITGEAFRRVVQARRVVVQRAEPGRADAAARIGHSAATGRQA
jgi:type I restriction enzyme S subunit